jgi:hypothetical protein
VVLALLAVSCGASGPPDAVGSKTRPDRTTHFTPPDAWYTVTKEPYGWPVAWAANVRFDPADDNELDPVATIRSLPPDGIVIVASGPRPYTGEYHFPRLDFPLVLADGYFSPDQYEGQPATDVSLVLLDTWVGGELLNVYVWFGRNQPTARMRADANRTLATLSVPD